MHYFISDAHIRTDESYRSKLLVKFLREIKDKMTHLYILGDLFEFWFEYNLVFPKNYFKTLAVLYNLIQDGKKVHYILGNHEVIRGSFLENFGFVVHNNHVLLTIDGRRVFLAHGNKVDRRLWITLWDKMLTSRLNHALYSIIHPDVGVFLAQGISYLSRKQQGNPNLVQLLEQYAQRKLREVDIVMLAHSHIPVLKRFQSNKYYINTGDWVKHFSYVVIDRGRVELRKYRQ
jgi:UDP-2,3-diacylglucosamine hydrolase